MQNIFYIFFIIFFIITSLTFANSKKIITEFNDQNYRSCNLFFNQNKEKRYLFNNDNFQRIQKLKIQRQKLSSKIYQLRVNMINNNSQLRIINTIIIELSKKIKKEIDNDDKIHNLIIKVSKIDKEINFFKKK